MKQFNEKARYAVWGTGAHAAQFLYENQELINIEFCIDNNVCGGGR